MKLESDITLQNLLSHAHYLYTMNKFNNNILFQLCCYSYI